MLDFLRNCHSMVRYNFFSKNHSPRMARSSRVIAKQSYRGMGFIIAILLFTCNLISCAEIVEFDCKDCKPFFEERIEQYDSRVDWKRAFARDLIQERHCRFSSIISSPYRKLYVDFTGFEKFRTGSDDKLVTVKIKNMVDDKSSDDSFRCIYIVAQENSGFLKIKLIKITHSAKWARMFNSEKTECEFQCPESLVKYLCVAPHIEFFHYYNVATPPQKVQPLLGNQLDVIVEIEE